MFAQVGDTLDGLNEGMGEGGANTQRSCTNSFSVSETVLASSWTTRSSQISSSLQLENILFFSVGSFCSSRYTLVINVSTHCSVHFCEGSPAVFTRGSSGGWIIEPAGLNPWEHMQMHVFTHAAPLERILTVWITIHVWTGLKSSHLEHPGKQEFLPFCASLKQCDCCSVVYLHWSHVRPQTWDGDVSPRESWEQLLLSCCLQFCSLLLLSTPTTKWWGPFEGLLTATFPGGTGNVGGSTGRRNIRAFLQMFRLQIVFTCVKPPAEFQIWTTWSVTQLPSCILQWNIVWVHFGLMSKEKSIC